MRLARRSGGVCIRLVRKCLVRMRRLRRVFDSWEHSHISGDVSCWEGQECRSSRSRHPRDRGGYLKLYDTRDSGAFP